MKMLIKPTGKSIVAPQSDAGANNIYSLLFGGPLPQPSPWIIQGPFIQYDGGVVVGNPLGQGMGPGTINIEELFINGLPVGGNLYKTSQLYYSSSSGQTSFSLSTPDRFGNSVILSPVPILDVTVGGQRLALSDGTGFGGFTVNPSTNTVTLLYPAGAGTAVIFDIYAPAPGGGGGGGGLAFNVYSEQVAVTGTNTFGTLTHVPDGQFIILFIGRQAFFAVGTSPDFSISGTHITWISTSYAIPAGTIAIAVYSYAG
jgi:hypothetical protein